MYCRGGSCARPKLSMEHGRAQDPPLQIINMYQFTLEPEKLEYELKKLIVQETEKDEFDPTEISDDEWLFGEQSRIQLDSLDALQVVVALQAHFGVRLQGDRMVRKHMMNVRDLAAFIREQHQKV